MLVTTAPTISGHNISKYLGLCMGSSIRIPDTSKKGLFDQVKGLVSGNASMLIQISKESRLDAYQNMIAHATELGANAIIGVSFDSSVLTHNNDGIEISCYGTAVIVNPVQSVAKPAIPK